MLVFLVSNLIAVNMYAGIIGGCPDNENGKWNEGKRSVSSDIPITIYVENGQLVIKSHSLRSDITIRIMDSSTMVYEETVKLRGTGGVKYETVINPTIKSEISSEGTSYSLVRYSSFPKGVNSDKYDCGSLGKGIWGGPLNDSYLLYKDNDDVAIYMQNFSFPITVRYVKPTTTIHRSIFLPYTKDDRGNSIKFKSDHVCKMPHSFNVNLGGVSHTFVSTKTFVPRLEWHPDWYNNYKDVFPYSLDVEVQSIKNEI